MPETLEGVDLNAVMTLTAHTRTRIEGCHCGWGMDASKLGQSHALHVWRELQRAVLPDHDARVRAEARAAMPPMGRYAQEQEPVCGVPHPEGGDFCQLLPRHDVHCRPTSGGFDAWRVDALGMLADERAQVAERIAQALLLHDPTEWALAGQHAGSIAAAIARAYITPEEDIDEP